MNRQIVVRILTFALITLTAAQIYAAGSGMPWESPINRVLDSFTGNVAKGCGVLAIGIVGLGIAFSEGGGLVRKLLNVALGLTITFTASSFFLGFLGFAGGIGF